MIPGVNPRQLQHMMKQMGMSQDELEATQVIIKTSSTNYVFNNPQVQKIKMQGQISFQITGTYEEEENKTKVVISSEDIKMVCEQAGVNTEIAKTALENNKGDIAQAIVSLS